MAATGIVAEPTQAMADLVASSPAFQAAVGLGSEAAALARVYLISAKGIQVERPFAIVSLPVNQRGGRGAFSSGEIIVIFEMEVDAAYKRDPEAEDDEVDSGPASEAIRNWAGAVIEEVMNEQENGGRLILRRYQQEGGLFRSPKGEDVDYFQLAYRFYWGTEPR
jgi:hypothetical protein